MTDELNKPNMVEWSRLLPENENPVSTGTDILDIDALCSQKDSKAIKEFRSCLLVGYEMRNISPSQLWQPKYNQFRCCMTNEKSKDQVSCVRYKCYEDVLLRMPYACQSKFFLWRDNQCLGYATEGYLGDCHDEVCGIVTMIYHFQTKLIFVIVFAILSATVAIHAATTKIFRDYKESGGMTKKLDFWYRSRKKEDTLITKDARKIAMQAANYKKTTVSRESRKWYYIKEEGGVVGPFNEDDMLERRKKNLIKDKTRIKCNNGEWDTVQNVYKNNRGKKPFSKEATPQFRLTKEEKTRRKSKVGPADVATGKKTIL